eukprot:jgi/Bigna1/92704/estExt_fgenesh1_pm.C_550007
MGDAVEICLVEPAVQKYAWGKIGTASAVAQLSQQKVDEKSPYAELWMGTHHKAPGMVTVNGKKELLSKVIGAELPYLFKVLSVGKALSIQAHPDKKLAEQLHKDRPEVYKDPNHKPEMTYAVTKFEAMCGFRPPKEIAAYLASYPEFKKLVGEETSKSFITCAEGTDEQALKKALTQLFTTVMEANKDDVAKQVEAMCKRLDSSQQGEIEKLLLRLNGQYPLDVGVFAPLFLNYVVLQPGDAMFLSANEPHAYLDGNCIECMACSDNVVRAGLTPKLRDTPTLCSMLTYKAMKPEIMKGKQLDDNTKMFTCPIDEFELTVTKVAGGSSYSLKGVKGHSLILAYDGTAAAASKSGTKCDMKKGSVLFVQGGADVTFTATSDLTIYRSSSINTFQIPW